MKAPGLCFGVLLAFATMPNAAVALCVDPADMSKYKYPTLDDEIRISAIIVVGTVTAVEPKSDDASDPESWTSFTYRVAISKWLKGRTDAAVALYAANDSGGYRMSLGQTYLLFLQRSGSLYIADPCGNSRDLPRGDDVLNTTVSKLKGQRIGLTKVGAGRYG
jgi:hypothetical protein